MRRFIIEKDFIVNGYRCVIIGNNLGYRCGYIEIPEDHSLHGKHYSVIDDIIDIHGGWTYSNFTNNNYPTNYSTNIKLKHLYYLYFAFSATFCHQL